MSASLEIKSGPAAGQRVELEEGKPVRIGRLATAQYSIADDRFLSGLHFEVLWDGQSCRVRDLGSANGTKIGGRAVTFGHAKPGDEIQAGESVFVLRLGTGTTTGKMTAAEIVQALAGSQPLYAILDSARTPRVLEFLSKCKDRFHSLYEGESAVHMASCAPYLVRLPEKSRLIRKLARDAWGDSWGVFLVSEAPFEDVRKHLRHFLIVQVEGAPDHYFRYYDPRVLPVFLGTCTKEERAQFFGPASKFLMEAEGGIRVEAR